MSFPRHLQDVAATYFLIASVTSTSLMTQWPTLHRILHVMLSDGSSGEFVISFSYIVCYVVCYFVCYSVCFLFFVIYFVISFVISFGISFGISFVIWFAISFLFRFYFVCLLQGCTFSTRCRMEMIFIDLCICIFNS